MKILSLFDGMACGHIAMQNAGVEIERYDAYEIDKYAIKVASHNFPDIQQHGDVFTADFTQYNGVDFVIGGSPCTYWSIAQKNNRETKASGLGWELFSQYVRAIKEAEPRYFIYENNKSMSKQIRASIDEAFGFEAVGINSALVSAQNRQRLYWVGKRDADGTYSKVNVEQPDDRGIMLRDILETTISEKGYFLSEPVNSDGNKAWTIKSQYYKNGIANFMNDNSKGCKYAATAVAEPVRIGTIESGERSAKSDSQANRVYSCDGKSVNLLGQGGDAGAKTGLYAVPSSKDTEHVHEVKDGFITIKDKQYPIKLADGYYIIRKLTVRECMRLQTVNELYDFSVISNSQAYKCLGNGWTCDVITHLILSALICDGSRQK